MFDIWLDEGQVCAVLRQGAAPSALFEEAKDGSGDAGRISLTCCDHRVT
jgi:hypothetical protein